MALIGEIEPDDPCPIVRDEGLAEIVKSGVAFDVTVTDTWAEWLRDPEVPVTVIV